MVIYCALLLADTQTAGSGQDHALDGLQGILAACIVVAGLLIMCTFVLLLMNARASGGMPMLRYMSLVGNYSGSPHLPLDWQVSHALLHDLAKLRMGCWHVAKGCDWLR